MWGVTQLVQMNSSHLKFPAWMDFQKELMWECTVLSYFVVLVFFKCGFDGLFDTLNTSIISQCAACFLLHDLVIPLMVLKRCH